MRSQRISTLQQRAGALGATSTEIDIATNKDDPKGELVNLILLKSSEVSRTTQTWQPLLAPVNQRLSAPLASPADPRMQPWQSPQKTNVLSGNPALEEALKSPGRAKIANSPPLTVGAPVLVAYNMQQLAGVVRYFGPTQFAEGDVVGVALEAPHGKNDGSVRGQRYFQCAPNHGLFVRPKALMSLGTAFDGTPVALPVKILKPKGKKSSKGGSKAPKSGMSPESTANLEETFPDESRFSSPVQAAPGNSCLSTPRDGRSDYASSPDVALGLTPFWMILGNVSAEVQRRAIEWCEEQGATGVDDVCNHGLANDFVTALGLKTVQKMKALEFFRRETLRKRANADPSMFQGDTDAAQLYDTLKKTMENNERRISLQLDRTDIDENQQIVNGFAVMQECFLDLKDIIGQVISAKVWNQTDKNLQNKDDLTSLIAESEQRLRQSVKESETRLREEMKAMYSSFPASKKSSAALGKDPSNVGKVDAKPYQRASFASGGVSAPKSYREAFEESGGESALKTWRHIGDQLIISDPVLESQVYKLLPSSWKQQGASTQLVQQHFVSSYDDLSAEAESIAESFMAKINKLAETSGGQANACLSKPPECAKLKASWTHGYGKDSVAWHRLTDVVGAVVSYPDIACLYRGLEKTICMFKGRVCESRDYYVRPHSSGFRELQVVVEHGGHMCLLKLNTSAMLEAEKSQGPHMDELQRDIERAVSEGNLEGCLSLLEWSERLGTPASAAATFKGLRKAAELGYAAIVRALLDNQADPNSEDARGNTALHLAAREGHDNVVWALLDGSRGVDYMRKNADGETPLSLVARLVRRDQNNAHAIDTLRSLAHAVGVDHVHEVALDLAPS